MDCKAGWHLAKRGVGAVIATLMTFSCAGCRAHSSETLIPLPMRFNDSSLLVVETSSYDVSIISGRGDVIVPPLVRRVWWNADLVITENHPMVQRRKFPGDTMDIPDNSTLLWYVIDVNKTSVESFHDRNQMKAHVESMGVGTEQIHLMKLSEAQSLRERELGFSFNTESVYDYLDSHGGR